MVLTVIFSKIFWKFQNKNMLTGSKDSAARFIIFAGIQVRQLALRAQYARVE